MVTLTYREEAEWSPEQISAFIKRVAQRANRRGTSCRYQWVIELTQRGRPHYHVLFWVDRGYRFEKPDRNGDWPHGSTRIELARSPVGYLVKYATKGGHELFTIPRHARLFGVGGGSRGERHATYRAGLPMWLDALLCPDARARRVARVGWVCNLTGEVFASPFRVGWSRDSFGIVVVTITKVTGNEDPNS